MNAEPESTNFDFQLDSEILVLFQNIRHSLFGKNRIEAEWLLYELERKIIKQFGSYHEQAMAVADANVRSVEIAEGYMEIIEKLKQQNGDLVRQKELIDKTQIELERQSKAMADSNVDAVFRLDEAEVKLSSINEAWLQLARSNVDLNLKSREMEKQANALATANVEAVLLMDEKESALAKLQSRSIELEATTMELEEKALVDSLTGLFNHRYFASQIDLEIARAFRYKRKLTLVFMDIDYFKKINDTYGHQVGDEVLSRIGSLIQSITRSADITIRINAKPMAVRYGGEEFVVILPETDLEGGFVVAEKIRGLLEDTDLLCGKIQPYGKITISGGVAELADGETEESLIQRADDALYKAKESGRNRTAKAPPPGVRRPSIIPTRPAGGVP
jgi:diguanylate cyclase (GGDEF)-like protein